MSEFDSVGSDALGYQCMDDVTDSSMFYLGGIDFAPVGADGQCVIDEQALEAGLQERIHQAVKRLYDSMKALETFIKTIEATGGLDSEGNPVGDPDWVDLGAAYYAACAALGVTPMEQQDE